MNSSFLNTKLDRIVGTKTAKILGNNLNIQTVSDLLWHIPRKYASPGQLTQIDSLVQGELVTIVGKIITVKSIPMKKKYGWVVQLVISDGSNYLTVPFFYKKQYIKDYVLNNFLVKGRLILLTGKVSYYKENLQLTHPDFNIIGSDANQELNKNSKDNEDITSSLQQVMISATKPVSIYPATNGLPSWKIGACIKIVLEILTSNDIFEVVPSEIEKKENLISFESALRIIHQPNNIEELSKARKRLKYQEAFITQVVLAGKREQIANKKTIAYPAQTTKSNLIDKFSNSLPFELTNSQKEVSKKISEYLSKNHPMNLLLHGEVGSGKTIVALMAMLQVVQSGGQGAIIAPTEILANQHFESITKLLNPIQPKNFLTQKPIDVQLLTGSIAVNKKKEILAKIYSGMANIVIGTHALFSEKVEFSQLGLVVVDEQHKFGVLQRDALREKNSKNPPHLLVMSATPIPRTMAMTVFGDLSVQTLKDVPLGRGIVKTRTVFFENSKWMARVWERVASEIKQGNRAFVVVPRIDAKQTGDDANTLENEQNSGKIPVSTIEETYNELLKKPILQGIKIGIIHSKLSKEQKEKTMQEFESGAIQLLISTTVVEVGIDIKTATTMVILDAQRFGISQLHQLRGRIRRSKNNGICLLVIRANASEITKKRMAAMEEFSSGFDLANKDLELRAEGDVLGENQSGYKRSFKFLSVVNDGELIEKARQDAVFVLKNFDNLSDYKKEIFSSADYLQKVNEQVKITLNDGSEFLQKT